jgi:hypothetical protein
MSRALILFGVAFVTPPVILMTIINVSLVAGLFILLADKEVAL